MNTALTIAGSDCSGGAGIQADLKTFAAHKVYGMSAITALTAQNTLGVTGISESSPEFFKAQLDAIFTDIYPDAVKIGMVASKELIETIADALITYKAKNIVLDPVMVSTSGSRLIKEDAAEVLKERLMVLADVITPNIPETEVLTGMTVANDCLCVDGRIVWLNGERVDNPNTHGTGCTLSSAIAANLAQGLSIEGSVKAAKEYLTGALKAGLNLGSGSGPLDHTYWLDINK